MRARGDPRPHRPRHGRHLSLGIGLDLPWAPPFGFVRGADGRDTIAPRTLRFLERYAAHYDTFFFSWQPRDRNVPSVDGYSDVLDDFFVRAPEKARGLHHTRLNMACADPRLPLAGFTNALAERYQLEWVNEDLGTWHHRGKVLPYPRPPALTDEGLVVCIENVTAWRDALVPRLRVEFPGFADPVPDGPWHAYDFFRRVIEESGADATLDVGHLIGWQWQRGGDLLGELHRLPLAQCVEIHLSGCTIVDGRWVDAHHGVLLDVQLELLERLLPLCPRLEVVTYEDPRFGEDGTLIPKSVAGWERLRAMVA